MPLNNSRMTNEHVKLQIYPCMSIQWFFKKEKKYKFTIIIHPNVCLLHITLAWDLGYVNS